MLLWPFNKYPGTDYETFNWEWILKTVKEYTAKVDDFIEDITNTWNYFRDDITDTWNDFKDWTTGEIEQMHDDFATYVNVTEGALNTGAISNGAITRPKLHDSLAGLIVDNDIPFSNAILEEIASGHVTTPITLSDDNKRYDFKGAIVDSLTVACIGSIIENLETANQITIKNGERNCIFKNIRSTNANPLLFESNTWANIFQDCSFIGDGTGRLMNAGANATNDTLIFIDCYAYNFDHIVSLAGATHHQIIGGWYDSVNHFYKTAANSTAVTINLIGVDLEEMVTVFQFDHYVTANLSVSGYLSPFSTAYAHQTGGAVNLYLNNPLAKTIPPFTDTSTSMHYVNNTDIAGYKFPVEETVLSQTVEVWVPGNASVFPFGNKVHLYKASTSDADATLSLNGVLYTDASVWNGPAALSVRNNSANPKKITVTIESQNRFH